MAKLSGYKTPDDPLPKLTGTKYTGGGQDGTYAGKLTEKFFDKTFSGKAVKGEERTQPAPGTGYIDDGRGERY